MARVPDIIHEPDQRRFVIFLAGDPAVLRYELFDGDKGHGTVDFTHTYVPPEYRSQGLAETLVRRGLSWAREQGYEVKASCWYVALFLR